MSFAKIRLCFAAILFVGWIGYLAYLALNFAHPVIVSRSQFMAADLLVVAEIALDEAGKPKPVVDLIENLSKGELPPKLTIANLTDLKYPEEKTPKAGKHLLLLQKLEVGSYKVAATPPSPGDKGGRVYIYPWLPDVEKQVKKMME